MKYLILTIACLIIAINAEKKEEFSSAPSNLPTKKIYVHGTPIANPYQPPNPPVAVQGQQSNIPAYGFEQQSAQAAPQPQAQPQFQSSAVHENLQSQNQFQQNQLGLQNPDAFSNSQGQEQFLNQPKKPGFPLQECYTNIDGFMCCNNLLEKTMNDAYDELKKSRNGKWSPCNIQQIANKVQEETESRFNTTFEVLAGVDDFASKSHFYHNYICKIERDQRYILAYATPRKDRLPQDIPKESYVEPSAASGDNYAPAPAPEPKSNGYDEQPAAPPSTGGSPSYGPEPNTNYKFTWRARSRR